MSRRKATEGYGKALDLWQAPSNAGGPLICVATTYTFDATFFETECIGRFLQMDAHPSESESVAYLIEREEKLAGARVQVLVDRRHARDKESLRWDVIGVVVPQGVQHAKLSLLAWANHVRLIIGSGNLTEPGYRKNLEVFGTLDLSREDGGNKAAIHATLEFLQELAGLGVGGDTVDTPKGRVRESLQRVRHHIRSWPGTSEPDAVPVFNSPRRSVLEQLRELWPSSSPAREAYVVSPFFDHAPNDARTAEAWRSLLAKRGDRACHFYVKTEPLPDGRTRVYAPKGIVDTLRRDASVEVTSLTPEQNGELREVHSKLLSLGNDAWRLLLIGSSNFTSAGLGTREGKGNCEANLVYRIKTNDPVCRRLDAIRPEVRDASLDLDSNLLIWEPAFEDAEEGSADLPLPAAFEEALFVPGDAARLQVTLGAKLPTTWFIKLPAGRTLLSSADTGTGTYQLEWRDQPVPFVLEVSWQHAAGTAVASWPVNVSNPAALPPPDAFRDLTLEELLEILGSTRPLSKAIVDVITRRARTASVDATLDPLKRLDSQAFLLRRTRRVARALDRLRERLERPALTKEAFEWRLRGTIGPMTLALAFMKESRLPGEAQFCLAELALTLRRVNVERTAEGGLSKQEIRTSITEMIREIEARASAVIRSPDAALLDEYVKAAFVEAAAR
jgi:hypothetical protein